MKAVQGSSSFKKFVSTRTKSAVWIQHNQTGKGAEQKPNMLQKHGFQNIGKKGREPANDDYKDNLSMSV